MRKFIFLDIDGTLIDLHRGHDFLPETKTALKQCQANGYELIINTGRAFSNLPPEILEFPFDGFICSCGCYVQYQGKVLRNYLMSQDEVKRINKLYNQAKIDLVFEGSESLYINEKIHKPQLAQQNIEFLAQSQAIGTVGQDTVKANKFSYLVEDLSDDEAILAKIKPDYEIIAYNSGLREIVPKGYNKGEAISFLLEQENCSKAETFAFGDSPNDKEMLERVDHGIAMKNGDLEVFPYANFITTDMADGGLVFALGHYQII